MARPKRVPGESPLFWMGSSKNDLLAFPEPVQDEIGTALSVAQFGGKHPSAKPWRAEGPGVFEVVEDHRGDTYRAVYTVRFEGVVYVLHASLCPELTSHFQLRPGNLAYLTIQDDHGMVR